MSVFTEPGPHGRSWFQDHESTLLGVLVYAAIIGMLGLSILELSGLAH